KSSAIAPVVPLEHELEVVPGTPADRGLIANYVLPKQPVKSVYFFAGNWLKGAPAFSPELGAADNTALYTMYPRDSGHLGWSEDEMKRVFALDAMQAANVNTVTMSYWGTLAEDRWRFFAPMYTSPTAHTQLFDEVLSRRMVIIPAIESGKCAQPD